MITAIISTEAISSIISLIILYGTLFESKQRNKKRTLFALLIIVNLFAMLADLISWTLDGKPEFTTLNFIMTMLSSALSFGDCGIFILYIYEYISGKKKVSFAPFSGLFIFAMASLVFTLVVSITGHLYTIQDGVYVEGSLYPIYLGANAVALLYGVVMIVVSRKVLGIRNVIVACSYVFIPVVSMLINAINPAFSMAYPAITLSLLIVYIFMQSEHVDVLVELEKEKTILAMHDEMTSLLNRRAYTEKLTELEQQPGEIGVVFCDVNGLKYANDHYGHEEGDALLVRFSELLQTSFRKEEIYRISGDEFVVLLPGISEVILQTRMEKLRVKVHEYPVPIASVGSSYGSERMLENLIRDAEQKMYQEKQAFYLQFPEYRR